MSVFLTKRVPFTIQTAKRSQDGATIFKILFSYYPPLSEHLKKAYRARWSRPYWVVGPLTEDMFDRLIKDLEFYLGRPDEPQMNVLIEVTKKLRTYNDIYGLGRTLVSYYRRDMRLGDMVLNGEKDNTFMVYHVPESLVYKELEVQNKDPEGLPYRIISYTPCNETPSSIQTKVCQGVTLPEGYAYGPIVEGVALFYKLSATQSIKDVSKMTFIPENALVTPDFLEEQIGKLEEILSRLKTMHKKT